MGDANAVCQHLEFLPVEGSNVIAYRLKDHAGGDAWDNIIVILNSRTTSAQVEVPEGKYTVVCSNGVVDPNGLGGVFGPTLNVPARSAMIVHQ
jgi:pullulanase